MSTGNFDGIETARRRTMVTQSRTRLTASERSEQVLRAAITAFAESGYAATKTDEIARLAGVSQPYVIRLFGTKQQLFIAAAQAVCDRIEEIFRHSRQTAGPEANPEQARRALGLGYDVFLTEDELPRLMLHAFAACSDPEIGAAVRQRFGNIYDLVRELTGASAIEASDFLAHGMLLTVMAGMRVVGPEAVAADWARDILDRHTED
jgi:AcrR family transcriptional regulator